MARDRYHHGNLREALLEVTQRVMESEGVHAVTMRRVAREVGVTHAAPYRHFPSKDALIDTVVSRLLEELRTGLGEGVEGTSEAGRIGAAVAGYVHFSRKRPAAFEALCTWPAARRQLVDLFRDLVGNEAEVVASAAHGLAVLGASDTAVAYMCRALTLTVQ